MGGWPVSYLQSMEELNSGPLKANPSSGREEDLNLGALDYQSSALPLSHARLPKLPTCSWTGDKHWRYGWLNTNTDFLFSLTNKLPYEVYVWCFCFVTGISGYVSSNFYRKIGGTNWVWNVVLTTSIFSGRSYKLLGWGCGAKDMFMAVLK